MFWQLWREGVRTDPEHGSIVAKTFGFFSFLGQLHSFQTHHWVSLDSCMIFIPFDEKCSKFIELSKKTQYL